MVTQICLRIFILLSLLFRMNNLYWSIFKVVDSFAGSNLLLILSSEFFIWSLIISFFFSFWWGIVAPSFRNCFLQFLKISVMAAYHLLSLLSGPLQGSVCCLLFFLCMDHNLLFLSLFIIFGWKLDILNKQCSNSVYWSPLSPQGLDFFIVCLIIYLFV